MPSPSSVLWFDNPESIAATIAAGLKNDQSIIQQTQSWFEKINLHPASDSSSRILDAFKKIISERSEKKTQLLEN
jgi:hypothetical protein